jgi:putative endonuclease
MFTVYVLYSDKYDKTYTGFTSNLEQRILSHNKLGKGWTARYRPWRVLYTEEFEDKKQAMKREKELKTGKGRYFIKTLRPE